MKNTILLSLLFMTQLSFGQFGFERIHSIPVSNADELDMAWAGGMDFCQFSNIDLNFDGVEDLFVFDRSCNKVLTFIQNGGPGEVDYTYAPEYEDDFPADLRDWVLLVDYDCDGKKDIYTYHIGGGSVYRNVGSSEDGNVFELTMPILRTMIYGDEVYMYISGQDIPAITDIDGDGDQDILAFGVLGTAVEYHKNMSMETYGVCDSLIYETKNICWGRFREDGATNEVTLFDTLVYPCDAASLTEESPVFNHSEESRQDRHAGSTVLALDIDGSGVMDLIVGDISYPSLTLLTNEGTVVNTNSGMYLQDNNFPSETTPVDLSIFPAAYHVDINNDGKRDLIAAPNARIGSENVESVWYYENTNLDLDPEFDFQSTNFLQGEMIEVGTSSFPVFFDHNGDGLLDLLLSSQGQYSEEVSNLQSKIAYYENVGTADSPAFQWVTDDYQDISTMDLGNSIVFYPTFGDLDGDGDEDMILGEYTGYCYYAENTGGAGEEAVFNTFVLLSDSEGDLIFDGAFVYPSLVDLDRDGDMDLTIGRRTGKIEYYENTGVGTYNFEFRTNELGGVHVAEEGFIEGQAIPTFLDIDGEYNLLVGSRSGKLHYYDDVDANIDGSFHLVATNLDHIDIGTYTAPAIADLDGDNRYEMVLGNRRGGFALFESAESEFIGTTPEEELSIFLFPNPANEVVTVELSNFSAAQLEKTSIVLYDLTGKQVREFTPLQNVETLSLDGLTAGTYLIQVRTQQGISTQKLIIQ